MQTWYKAVCDRHQELCQVFIVKTVSDDQQDIVWPHFGVAEAREFLHDHYGCPLRLFDETLPAQATVGYKDRSAK